jgi:predicted DCC family thiol-disulfide oxidoreductase YuxK
MKVILFDGVCNLCNGWVNRVIDADKQNQFKFASLQSNYGVKAVERLGLGADYLNTIIFYDNGKVYLRSNAVLQIARSLGGVYSLALILLIIPQFIRDFVYNLVANNRYRWFGKMDACRVPTPELKSKFLD